MTGTDQRLAGIERQLAALVAAVEGMRKDGALREAFIEVIEDRAEARGFERGRAAARPNRRARPSAQGSRLRIVSGGAR